MPKRKPAHAEDAASEPPRRRSLRNSSVAQAASPKPAPKLTEKADTTSQAGAPRNTEKKETKPTRQRGSRKAAPKQKEESQEPKPDSESEPEPPAKKKRVGKQQPKAAKATKTGDNKPQTNGTSSSSADGEKNYWLLKAEPTSRFENGVDVKFSIDDLAAKTKPEPWDGIRAYPARNNLRAMKKGDLAFFYHSNCKEPGIVGTMEIVQEHSPDLSAHDPKAPYYDASSKPSDPKWSVVHVEFRTKFAVPIVLKELRVMGAPGKPLENMQMLKQSRLSVSKVSAAEWAYLMKVAEEKAVSGED